MYKPSFLFLASVALFAACAPESANEPANAGKGSTPEVKKELSKAALAALEVKEKNAEKERVAKESSELVAKLNEDFTKANAAWMKAGQENKDQESRQAHFDSRPCLKYAEDLAAIAKKYPGTAAAKEAWPLVLKWGLGDCKFEAADVLLDVAKTEPDATKAIEGYEYIMSYAFGEPQKEAMELMLEFAKEKADPETGFEVIKKIVSSRRGMMTYGEGYLVSSGNEEVRAKAIKELKLIVQADINSERAVESLELMHGFGSDETKDVAFQQLVKHHATHESTMNLVGSLSRQVSRSNEKKLKSLLDHSNTATRANAAVALSNFYSAKQLESQFYESASHEQLSGLGDERMAYLKEGIAEEDLAGLEEKLARYVKENKNLLGSAERTLFALQNLGIGKTAPDIVGNDLDGVEFKLSDYRGKVVFLDFWGDW